MIKLDYENFHNFRKRVEKVWNQCEYKVDIFKNLTCVFRTKEEII